MTGSVESSRAKRRSSDRLPSVSFSMHRGIEGLLGIGLVLLPTLFGFSPSAFISVSVEVIVAAGAIGLVMTLLGFAGGRKGNPKGPAIHLSLDRIVLAALLIAAGAAWFVIGDSAGTVLLAAAVVIYGLLYFLTRFDSVEVAAEQPEVQPAEVPEEARVGPRTVADP